MPKHPPKYPLRFLRWFCREDFIEEIEGDLVELFEVQYEERPRRAKWIFLWRVITYFRPDFIKAFSENFFINTGMFKHNLIISYRSFLRNKSSFLINLLGLSSGLVCALLIFLWVQDEVRIDKFHEKDDQLYQIGQATNIFGDTRYVDWAPGPLAKALKAELPEVESAVSVKYHPDFLDGVLKYEDQTLKATPQYVNKEFFDIFTYPLLHGNKDQVLEDKHSVIISEDLAFKLFSTTRNAIGKTIEWEKKFGDFADYGGVFTISGVFENIPSHSTQKFDVIFNYAFFAEISPGVDSWDNDQATSFFIIKKGADISSLNKKITDLVNSKRDWEREFVLQKYSSKYLYNDYEKGLEAGGRIEYVWLFSAIALLILLIASINFMNLSTARASVRVKEIGVKKTLGASRENLIAQFVNESLLLTIIALVVAVGFVIAFLPQFNQITGKELTFIDNLNLLPYFVGIALATGLVSSIYPALYLSGFNPIEVLKGKLNVSFGEVWARKGLVVFQFSISVVLIVSVLVVYLQMSFVQDKNLGYDRDNILSIKKEGALEGNLEAFLTELRTLPEVKSATNSGSNLVGSENFTGGFSWEGMTDEERMRINVFSTNYDFLKTYGINLKAGRDFSREYGTETSKVIINEVAAKRMGFDNPIGKIVTFWDKPVEIIGITDNFQYQSLYSEVQPCIFYLFEEGNNSGDRIWVKIKAGQEREAIASIGETYEEFNPGYPFEYGFVDDAYQALYESESRVAMLSKYFAGLAIIISCLGLFGLAAFTSERRMKEIGIRKILGSSVWGIIKLLSADFTKMVIAAIIIALPISYIIVQNWLSSFVYKIDMEWWFFAGTALMTLAIAWITIGFQTLKIARINPTACLRDE